MAYDRYGNYSPSQAFFGSLGTGLSDVLGGYLGAKVEQDKMRRQYESNKRILKVRYPKMSQEELDEVSKVESRFLPGIMGSFDQRQQRQREGASVGALGERLGVDQEKLQGMEPREQRSYLDTLQQKEQQQQRTQEFAQQLPGMNVRQDTSMLPADVGNLYNMQQRARQEQEAKNEVVKQQLIDEGYSASQVDKALTAGTFSEKDFRKKIPKGLTFGLKSLHILKKNWMAGRVSEENMSMISPVEQMILKGEKMNFSPTDPILSYFRQEAKKRLDNSQKFRMLPMNKKQNKLGKLARKFASSFGYKLLTESELRELESAKPKRKRAAQRKQKQPVRSLEDWQNRLYSGILSSQLGM